MRSMRPAMAATSSQRAAGTTTAPSPSATRMSPGSMTTWSMVTGVWTAATRPATRYDGETGLVGVDDVALVDRESGDFDQLAGGALLPPRRGDAVPDIEIRTQEIDTHEAAAGLLDRTLDWAIVRKTAPVRGTTATSLLVDRFVAALPADHPAAGTAVPLDLAELSGDTWVWLHRNISPDYHDAMASMCRTAGFSPLPAHWARSVTSEIAMVECGLGVTVVPAAAAAVRRAVRFRPLSHGTAAIGLTAMTRSDPDALVRRLTALTTRLTAAQAPPPPA
ncbi:DNA-binding transcriptional LysR family regulator [Streptomyces sp. V4I23]|uniref:LysR family substrate-binding domain-containing protein n=1 Tax=Streptomyces sp. V4I23 TaxID=3042282 RepID=UPI002783C5C0|nr:LysR family substrate-binding domain-containing protein [Streptomyces sp. V4I23]MDQ1006773.1 DNA-binding transcriptional LysR family regulator [Streptomyces sp. V4I23]